MAISETFHPFLFVRRWHTTHRSFPSRSSVRTHDIPAAGRIQSGDAVQRGVERRGRCRIEASTVSVPCVHVIQSGSSVDKPPTRLASGTTYISRASKNPDSSFPKRPFLSFLFSVCMLFGMSMAPAGNRFLSFHFSQLSLFEHRRPKATPRSSQKGPHLGHPVAILIDRNRIKK
ncbi:hypothetical protein CEXT_234191 [Caerostris extrusa]|uniref:Uncharacterized protein n=1 Tax=Caerostris extrusa TaxID=172846 RepID=A0AAV4QZN6_CAEEX|nr:hypothetical protein CEXT_234191 [Caerostris extrusa]